ncbi:hypothetical protein MIND_00760400 [Mycena indigotica]|uniref:Pentatricopeptide repeat-containing protein n=1 Tax=Mycena indigotica TaxID=2126181 RepID=A0A8H6SMV8_9AGAR|nr:uncharacterized protein MIND_00760400 [Mycena indigotica]KAF7301943.1 hypothetical protein MIND_00760400 [Mycena indigotica]
MVEPLLLTTLRRPLAKTMTNAIRIQLAPDFFSPRPRNAKGKERMSDDTVLSFLAAKSQDWSCRMRVSVWCQNGTHRPESDAPPRKRPRGPRRARSSPPPIRGISILHQRRGQQARQVSQLSSEPPPLPDSDEGEPIPIPDPPSETSADALVDDPDSPRNVPDPPAPGPHLDRLRGFKNEPDANLEELWSSFEVADTYGLLGELSAEELLGLVEAMADTLELTSQQDDLDRLHKWGERVGRVLESVSSDSEAFHHLQARVMALQGDVQKALDIAQAHRPDYADFGPFLRVYESILVSTWRHFDRVRALEFLVLEWKTIGSYLLTETSRIHSGSPTIANAGRSLRQTAFAIVSALPDPVGLLAQKRNSDWDDTQRQHMGDLLIEALIRADLPLESSNVLLEMRRQHLDAAPHMQLFLVRALAREHCFAEAQQLFSSLPRERRFDYFFTGLYLNAHEGLETAALDYFNRIADAGWMTSKVVVQLMYVYAIQGHTKETVHVFQEYFPEDDDGVPSNNPTLEHFGVGLLAHAQSGDYTGTRFWLELMRRLGLEPDAYVFSTILKTFALQGDLDSISVVLDQMRQAGCRPNHVTYTTVMTLLAHRKDPANVEALYARALREGVIPDTKMVATVMNAHVEAGSWAGVIRAFDFTRAAPHRALTIGVYNILLKAYVQIGAPFRIVSRVFARLEKLRLRPDAYTFTLLLQSACDARMMDVAEDIFGEMERLAERWGSSRHVTTWALTVIMAGFLRLGQGTRAMAVYEDMGKRGLRPNSITYGHILTSYGREGTEDSFKLAEEFIKTVKKAGPERRRDWDTPDYGRLPARSRLYIPLMRSYIQKRRPKEVARLFGEIIQDGGTPTLSLLTILLRSYSAMHDIRSIVSLWPQIFELGVKYCAVPVVEEHAESRIHTFVLCDPLSIYIRELARAEMHDEIARVWREFQEAGFSFSSDNWNELGLALLGAGELERACEVLERVVLPYQRQSVQAKRQRTVKPTSPLLFADDTVIPVPLELPKRAKTRADANKWHNYHRRAAEELGSAEHADDLAHQLHIVHQISPVWNSWTPRHSLLGGLFRNLLRLRAGHPIDAEREDMAMDESTMEKDELAARKREAATRLEKILVSYPDTVAEVSWFEDKEQRRLGKWYERVYPWAAAIR